MAPFIKEPAPIKTSQLLLIGLVVATILSALGTLSSGLYWISENKVAHWAHIFWYQYSHALVWCLFLPILLRVVEALPFEQFKWAKLITWHGLTGGILVPIHRFLATSLDFFIQISLDLYSHPNPNWWDRVSDHFIDNSIKGITTYIIIVAILYSYIFYWRNIKERMAHVQMAADLSKAKLRNLEAQLQPHFLFNAMQSITALMHKDIKEADNAMNALSELLRMAFQKTDEPKIKLREELAFCYKYAALQKMRYQDRLCIGIFCAEDLKDYLVPVMILQPFIENSIKHAVNELNLKAVVNVECTAKEDRLLLEIVDNGSTSSGDIQTGTGMENTMSRLKFLYKQNFSFTYGSIERQGFFVKIDIPIETSDAND